jgi:beta-1,4-mannosyl-glycoprotein beta-1,4-N-acetylglucosaminyltransferase
MFFLENSHLFEKFKDKIIYLIDNEMVVNASQYKREWQNENHQRNYLDKGITSLNLDKDDLIIITDADEIPDPELLKDIRKRKINAYAINIYMDMYYYDLTLLISKTWGLKIFAYDYYVNILRRTPQLTRVHLCENMQLLEDRRGGWHLSYFGDAKHIQNKLMNFAHQEFNFEEFTSIENIENGIKNKVDIMRRDNQVGWKVIPISENTYLPPMYETFLSKFLG